MKKTSFILFLVMITVAVFPGKNSFAAVAWVSTSPLPPAYVGVPYMYQLQATGTSAPYIYYIPAGGGSLPAGLTLNSTSGIISGTASSSSSINLVIRAEEASPVSLPEFADQSFAIKSIASELTGPLTIKRVQLSFDNNRPEITIVQNQPPPGVYASLRITGSGILRGYWTIDGAIHSQINRVLSMSDNITLHLPQVPSLPTFRTGGHRVRLVIADLAIAPVPEIIYYVTEAKRAPAPIGIISPAERQEVDFAPLSLSWQLQAGTIAYLVEFLEEGEEKPIFSAYTRQASYTIPSHTLAGFFAEKKSYVWRVKAIAEDDSILNESEGHQFTFR